MCTGGGNDRVEKYFNRFEFGSACCYFTRVFDPIASDSATNATGFVTGFVGLFLDLRIVVRCVFSAIRRLFVGLSWNRSARAEESVYFFLFGSDLVRDVGAGFR